MTRTVIVEHGVFILHTVTRCPRCQRRLPPNAECPVHGAPSGIVEVIDVEAVFAAVQAVARAAAPDGWTLGERLASGGTAIVFHLTRPGLPPAVLKLARHLGPDVRARFEMEAEILREVGAPTTPAYIAHGNRNGTAFVAMEHVAGDTLATWMSRRQERGALGEILGLLTSLAHALARLHRAGYVHRDLKPENIVISATGVRLLDFGLAKPTRRTKTGAITQLGHIVGTLHYLAPEQVKGDDDLDHRADIYSFGVIAYEMLTGRPPFSGERRALEYHHAIGKPPSVCESRRVPVELDELVMCCLAKSPEQRPQDIDTLLALIARAMTALETLPGHGAAIEKPAPRALGTTAPVAALWIDGCDPVAAVRAIHNAHGIVVNHRGGGLVAAFTSQELDAPLEVALDVARSFVRERGRAVVHLTDALVRRSSHGKPMVYGAEIERPDTWLPQVPIGLLISVRAAREIGDRLEPSEVPTFFRLRRRDVTDNTDARNLPPLVGRSELVAHVAGVLAAPGMLVEICGASGLGKSRLVREIADRLRPHREVICVRARARLPGDRADDDRISAALGGPDLASGLVAAARRGAVLLVDDAHHLSSLAHAELVRADLPIA
ncbi:MAG: protein kinase, partial [Kofleriaceae bacterium]